MHKGSSSSSTTTSVNPFERRVTRPKHSVLGRRLKGTEQNLGQSRARATEIRRNTLLPEFEARGRAGGIQDHRIGAQDASLAPEDVVHRRFQKERERQYTRGARGNIFHLTGDEDEYELTHMGASLSSMDAMRDENFFLSDDDDEIGTIDAQTVGATHFGGFVAKGGEEERGHKSRQEIMQEVIAKSKMHKAERQKEKQDREEKREALDEEYLELMQQGLFKPSASTTAVPPKASASWDTTMAQLEAPQEKQSDSFQTLLKELALEAKQQAGERLKTPEDLLEEQRQRLEKLERARIQRMQDSDSDNENETRASARHKRRAKASSVATSADALDDDFDLGDSNSEQSEEEEEDEEDHQNESEEKQVQKSAVNGSAAKAVPTSAAAKDLPYTFAVPESLTSFISLLQDRSADQIRIILERIAICNPLGGAPENRAKLEAFYGIIWEYFGHVTKEKQMNMDVFNLLARCLFDLAPLMPHIAFAYAHKTLQTTAATLQHNLQIGEGTWLKVEHFVYLELIAVLFPVSDFRHPLTTPAMLLIGHALAQGPIRTTYHAICALALSSLFIRFIDSAKRIATEALQTLRSILQIALHSNLPEKHAALRPLAHNVLDGSFLALITSPVTAQAKEPVEPLSFIRLLTLPPNHAVFQSYSIRFVSTEFQCPTPI
eukprot:TRINITY_DN4272_c1_g1_i2.p1 TRINITY_DN4272_c1_g1~~TRINITY_DN4272_c1_g1_i2.p1  ORF type:complete len:664 (-),score=121.83 TRINITY_DN4272_c1_g1_i2:1427-3418(-)